MLRENLEEKEEEIINLEKVLEKTLAKNRILRDSEKQKKNSEEKYPSQNCCCHKQIESLKKKLKAKTMEARCVKEEQEHLTSYLNSFNEDSHLL